MLSEVESLMKMKSEKQKRHLVFVVGDSGGILRGGGVDLKKGEGKTRSGSRRKKWASIQNGTHLFKYAFQEDY